ncbi:MAG: hypothetical protein OXE93_04305 [bacterium]|nr:hypothetical protein [bacterium]
MRARALLGGFLAMSLFGSLLGAASASATAGQAQGQVQGSASFKAGYRNLNVVGTLVNVSDPTEDGSLVNPFAAGSRIELRIDVRGFDLPSLRFIPGSVLTLGGAARGMSSGASNGWYLKSAAWNHSYAQGMAHISIPSVSVTGGAASWALNQARLQLIEDGRTITYNVPALQGSFYIGAAPAPVVENISVTAAVSEVEVSAACRSAAPSSTHQVQLDITAKNAGSTDLQNVNVEWYQGTVVPPRGGSASGVLLTEEGVIFGDLPSGTTKQGNDPAMTYCLTVPAGSQQQGHLAVVHSRINGYASINGVQHGRYLKLLGALSAEFSVSTPAPTPDPEPEVTLPGGPTQTGGQIDEGDSNAGAQQQALLAKVAQAGQAAVDAHKRADELKALSNKLIERYRKAYRAHKKADKKLAAVVASHKAAVAKAERLADRAEGRGQKAQERADKAADAVERQAAKLARQQQATKTAQDARDTAKRRADQALADMKAAIAEAEVATEALKVATAALNGAT